MANYVARDIAYTYAAGATFPTGTTNPAQNPQPGEQDIVDIFGNQFENWNKQPGTYQFNGSDINTGVLPAYEVQYVYATGATFPTSTNNVLKNPQPLYQNLNYKRYIIQYVYAAGATFPTSTNSILDPSQPLPDAAQWVDNQIQYVYGTDATFPTSTTPVARTPQPYQSMRIQYVYASGATFPTSTINVDRSVQLKSTDPVYLLLDVGDDPDDPVLVYEDDVYSVRLDV